MKYQYQNPLLERQRERPLQELLAQRGMVTYLAQRLGISKAAVAQWRAIPEHHLPAISRLLDVPQYQLREAKTKRQKGA